jgi:hypothetical protein
MTIDNFFVLKTIMNLFTKNVSPVNLGMAKWKLVLTIETFRKSEFMPLDCVMAVALLSG